ncbi:MAG: hypothetical protein EOP38_08610 [Rubrivivax sp.]|nr:MAG: hypothetical protein EOP38_08610 [Rubrivivax sp.]
MPLGRACQCHLADSSTPLRSRGGVEPSRVIPRWLFDPGSHTESPHKKRTGENMKLRKLLTLATKVAAVGLLGGVAHAGYFQWETVTAPVGSNASCGNGTPYRFFVNRTPFSTKTVVMFEGGGACWDQGACKGGTLLDAANPDGIPANYMTDFNRMAHLGLVTPFTARVHPLQAVQTQSWNIVYVPYCTGDVHAGNRTVVYDNADPANPLAYMHRGAINSRYVANWLGANLPRPDHLLMTGFSAGGVGSSVNYATFRQALNPKKMALLADSGPLMMAPRNGDPAQYPSLPLHNKIREAWGLDGPKGLLTELLAQYPNLVDPNNLGTANVGLAKLFPNDRLGMAVFQEDAIYSAFSYQKFFPDIANAPSEEERLKRLNVRWRLDLKNLQASVAGQPNLGYYVPNKRVFNGSHCLTILTFGGTSIAERRLPSVGVFVDNLLDGTGPVLRAEELNPTTQRVYLSDWFADWIAPFIPI